MAPTPKQNAKPVFKTSSPFTETKWPQVSHDDQQVILDLICNLIAPLGDHRRAHIYSSKGKKRKRKSKSTQDDSTMAEAPLPPEIGKRILVGINSVTRHLEALAATSAPPAVLSAASKGEGTEIGVGNELHAVDGDQDWRRFSLLIVTHPNPALSPAHAHIPTLVHLSTVSTAKATTSVDPATNPATRLIPLPTSTDSRLASKLHIPRVGALGIFEGAPGAKALEDYVRQYVDLTECKWIDEAVRAEWKGVNVENEPVSKAKK